MDTKKLIAILALALALAAGAYLSTRGGSDTADTSKADAEKIKSLGYAH